MDDALVPNEFFLAEFGKEVLILVVMDDALVLAKLTMAIKQQYMS